MHVIGLAGYSGAGKTTLLARVLPRLVAAGVTVSTLKHAHHDFDIDHPGKDSYRHRAAGAREVLVASSRRFALMHENAPGEDGPSLVLLRRLSPVDLVIVEGFKSEPHPKLEVHRAASGLPLLLGSVPNIRAVVSDTPLTLAVPVLPLDDVDAIAEGLRRHAAPLAQVLAALPGPCGALP